MWFGNKAKDNFGSVFRMHTWPLLANGRSEAQIKIRGQLHLEGRASRGKSVEDVHPLTVYILWQLLSKKMKTYDVENE